MGNEPAMLPLVCVVLVNYNNAGMTLECVESLQKSTYSDYKIIVVDNCSIDDSWQVLQAKANGCVLLQAIQNNGFSAGNNIGIRYALQNGADYVWILNNDTVVSPQAMSELVQASNNEWVTTSKILYYDEPQTLNYAGGQMDYRYCRNVLFGKGEKDCGQHDIPSSVNFASGCSMMLPARVLEQVGPWNEDFFMYWEDVDYCIRLEKAGVPMLYCPTAPIWHREGATAGRESAFTVYYANRNRFYVLQAHCPGFLPRLYTYGTRLIYYLAGLIKGDSRKTIGRAFRDYRRGAKGKSWKP